MKIKEITDHLEAIAPLSMQESYDNAGLLTGSSDMEVNKALITLDVTEEVMDEAMKENCDMIIAHHPVIFKGLKKINGNDLVERVIIKAIKNDIAIYAIHTNLDNMMNGVNAKLGEKLGLSNLKVLKPSGASLKKVVVFCPVDHAEKVREAMFSGGAGHIGNYDSCSYNLEGEGTFRALEGTHPYVGEKGKLHFEKEVRIETIVPSYKLSDVIGAMLAVHPYEEVAYDVYPLDNEYLLTGAGMIGELETPEEPLTYLQKVKETLGAGVLKYNDLIEGPVKKVAFCGGSGAFLIHDAARAGADLFITADVKYHDFFEHLGTMTVVDAGHYETEQFTKELLYEIIKEKFPTFAVQISKSDTNPVKVL